MNRVYIFDVDGTLTPSRQKMTKEFQEFFEEWSKKNKFYLVTGSDLPKLQEQMDGFDISAEAIFTCCGNEMWKPDPHIVNISAEEVYSNEFTPPKDLIKYLWGVVNDSMCPIRIGNHIEDRDSMLNFSVVGRDCNLEQRQEYFEWDNINKERESVAKHIRENWPYLDAVIGGQISIDIYPKGYDKSQILEHIEKRELEMSKILDNLPPHNEYIFIGDRIMPGGNDWPLSVIMNEREDCSSYQTEGPEQTKQILEKLSD